MEVTTILLVNGVLALLIAYWADNWGRNPWFFGLLAFFFSPLFMSAVLVVIGRSEGNKIKRFSEMYNKMEKVREDGPAKT